MLYVKKYFSEKNEIHIVNTETNEVITLVDFDVNDLEELKKRFNEPSIAGVISVLDCDVALSIHEVKSAVVNAISCIDYKDCSPVIIYQDNVSNLGSTVSYDALNISINDEELTLGDIALKSGSYKQRVTDLYYIKDNYLYVLVDYSTFHLVYFKYKILNYDALTKLTTKYDILCV